MSLDIWLEGRDGHNVTHNLSPMWRACGCWTALYDSPGKTASEVLPALIAGLQIMLLDRARFESLNPSNGWGDYEGACQFLLDVILEFSNNPERRIEVSR